MWALVLALFLIVVAFAVIVCFYLGSPEEMISKHIINVLFVGLIGLSFLFCAYCIVMEQRLKHLRAALVKSETEAKIADAVRAEKVYSENIIASMGDLLIVVDLDGKIKTVNWATEELLGFKENELAGQPARILFEEATLRYASLGELLEEGAVRNYETTCLTKTNEKIPISLTNSVMRNGEGKSVAIIIVARDISESKKLEEQTRKRMLTLEDFGEESKRWSERKEELEEEVNKLLSELGRPGKYGR